MTEARTTGLSPFMYAIIRVVPDPIRDEAINVGVVVTPTEGSGGRMRVSNRVRTRIRSLQPDYGFDALDQTLEDLRHALGLDPQPELSESAPAPATARLLEDAAKRLCNQIQLTEPRPYRAASSEQAVDRLFERYVGRRAAGDEREAHLTHGALKRRIWNVVRTWAGEGVHVEQDGLLKGKHATHAADVVIRNGTPRAALFALATHPDSRNLVYHYRDSLPTIAEDTKDRVRIYAVLPDLAGAASPEERQFFEETKELLASSGRVRTVAVADLPRVRGQVMGELFDGADVPGAESLGVEQP